ncbi:hypothetical protein P3T76_004019 [Phytophthora citrophthora]|uniref:Fibronectin type-III domain-containing protein n=1 Tax=Phytophthora citrophthora TaxID=4793 RepID=A0AAD9LQZ3_9STRA|nr:hypothetical protein P3T76_004019 [Phytophthora citrophthora]
MGYRWSLVLALLLVINTVFSEEVVGNSGDSIDSDVAAVASRDEKKTRSFVTPTHGSSSSLTLTTFLTDAAHLHYAVLLSGQNALDAAGIKSSVAQCRTEVSEIQSSKSNKALQKVQSAGVVAADTVTISMAQKVVSIVENLMPNTSYDVYLVAEVIGSNGVFGPVQSVLQSITYPEPPKVDITAVQPSNATSDTVWINATLTTPGRAYFALIPNGKETENVQLKAEDLVKNRTGDVKSHVTMHDIPLGTNESYAFQEIVKGLIPATLYNVFAVTEAPGTGEVRSELIHYGYTVRTHALAPEVSELVCSPLNASATALDIRFSLEVDEKDIDRVTMETLAYFTYDLHYEVIALSDSSTSKKKNKVTTSTTSIAGANAATRSTDDISALKNTTIRGKFSFGNFSTAEDFHTSLKETHHANITGLESGILYKVKLRAETAGSHGLFGLRELSAQAKTHEEAPSILAASIQATNKSVNTLTLTVDLEREQGNIHYVLTGKPGAASSLRSLFQQASSIDHLLLLLRDRSPQDYENVYVSGVFNFSSDERVSVSDSKTPVKPGKSAVDTEEEAFRERFMISGLEDAASYSIVLLPETSKSFGLFGRAFSTLLEGSTNENASEVELRSAKPLHGNTTAIQLEINMTKSKDILFLCLNQQNTPADTEVPSECQEMEDRGSLEASKVSSNIFTFTIGNLTEDTEYHVSLYAENTLRNGVVSKRSEELSVRTHKSAPKILETSAHPSAASTSQVDALVTVEPGSSCILHYVVRELEESVEAVDAATIVEHSSETSKDSRSQLRLPSSSSFITGGNVLGALNEPTTLQIQGLSANTTYQLFVVTETSQEGNSSGVYGGPVSFNVTTHALAPKIVLATVDPVDGSTNSVVISANLSHPGMLHYFLSDVDFADPAVISSEKDSTPHELRGQLEILEKHILMEVINGTNDTRPTDPLVFVHNTTVSGLKPGTTYHVSLTTETYESDGVYGEFPPPVLVNTHLGPPVIIPDTLSVHPVDGSSSALVLDFQLDRFGEVHYALFFRGLVPDRSQAFEQVEHKEEVNESSPIWPPLISTFDLTKLSGSMLKAADLEELGVGVWENDTIKVSREDMTRGKMTHKKIDKLPPNALFDVCLVSETAASGGILGWPEDGSTTACHRVSTHGDYTNQSKLLDEISIHPVRGRTEGIRINLNVSKLLRVNASKTKVTDVLDRFAESTGRVPYFVLIDSKSRSGRDLGGLISRGEVTSAFKEASPGRSDGVVAAGMLWNITNENSTALQIEQDVFDLEANHEYLLFFAYETSGSNGVFTKINPHKHRSNDTRYENDGIPVKTHESAPRIPKAKAEPTAGDTSSITVKFDVSCDSCKSAVVHLLLFPDHCKTSESVEESLRLDQLSETNMTINATEVDNNCLIPLIQKRVEFNLSDRHNRNDIEQELGGAVLLPNTSYIVLIATETAGAGVISKTFEEPLRVRTHAPAPSLKEFRLEPRTGSTTELVLTFSLDRPGEVHYMLGPSGNDEFNVTSPHNISSKGVPNGDRRGRDRDSHNYRTDVVRTRRSVTYSTGEYVELLDYLMPGTSYSLFIVSEALPADHGVYGFIHEVKEVSTFANAPILLAHAAYPTPGTTKALTVGFRMDGPGIVYFSAVAVKPWDPMKHVAKGSDQFGNRLALKDQLVVQKSLDVTRKMMELESDSGWREMMLEVPHSELNYTVHLVTETKNSGGIFGTVATHAGVRAHSEAPILVDVSVSPSDARVDALTVNVSLNDRGHVHYIALPSGRAVDFSNELSVRASGSVDVNETGDQKASFVIAGLTEGSSYDLYFRSETFESFGVFGEWATEPVTARTHGLPAEVLVDAVKCMVMPSCEQRGRETCSRKENVCGKCLEGYEAVDEAVPEANEPCMKLNVAAEAKRGSKIKINSVTRNPNLHVSETEMETDSEVFEKREPIQAVSEEESTLDVNGKQESVNPEAGHQDATMKEHEHIPVSIEYEMIPQDELTSVSKVNEQIHIPTTQDVPELAKGDSADQGRPVTPDRDVRVDVTALGDTEIAPKAEPEHSISPGCPLNAQPTPSGLCECIPGYEVDEGGTSCVLSHMETAAQAAADATSTVFDILNAHSQVSSQST